MKNKNIQRLNTEKHPSIKTTFNRPYFSLDNTFNQCTRTLYTGRVFTEPSTKLRAEKLVPWRCVHVRSVHPFNLFSVSAVLSTRRGPCRSEAPSTARAAPGDHEPLIGGARWRSMGELRLGRSVTWSFCRWTYRQGTEKLHGEVYPGARCLLNAYMTGPPPPPAGSWGEARLPGTAAGSKLVCRNEVSWHQQRDDVILFWVCSTLPIWE